MELMTTAYDQTLPTAVFTVQCGKCSALTEFTRSEATVTENATAVVLSMSCPACNTVNEKSVNKKLSDFIVQPPTHKFIPV